MIQWEGSSSQSQKVLIAKIVVMVGGCWKSDTSRQVFDGIPIPTERRHEPLLIIEGDGDHSLMRVRTELYHKAISVESPGQGALSNRELESLTRGFQTSPQKPETSEEELC